MLTHLLISFLVGGVFIALQTLIGERVEGFWRGAILTIPSTLALGLLFIGLTKTPADVVDAARIVPSALGPDYFFVAALACLARFGFFIGFGSALLVWGAGAWAILKFPPASFVTSIIIGLILIFIAYAVVAKLPSGSALKKYPVTLVQILIRSGIGGTIISLIVLLSNTLGNNWGGLFSAFPGSFTATFVIYYIWQGRASIPEVSKTLFFPGAIGFMIYGLTAGFIFPHFGIWLGTLAAYLATFVFFALFYIISHKAALRAAHK